MQSRVLYIGAFVLLGAALEVALDATALLRTSSTGTGAHHESAVLEPAQEPARQGLTLVLFSAQPEHILWVELGGTFCGLSWVALADATPQNGSG